MKIMESKILQSAPNDPKPNISHFRDIPHFSFPIDSYAKFKSDTKFLIWGQSDKISITLYSPMTAVFILKFGLDRMKNVRGVAFCNFQRHRVLG